MRQATVVYRFGDFELHPISARLMRGRQRVPLGHIHVAILTHLVRHESITVGRDAIATAGWGGTAAPNSVEKAISVIRRALGDHDGSTYIETVPNRGYRFVAAVQDVEIDTTVAAGDLIDAPLRASDAGERELTTLNRRAIADARREFERAIEHKPEYAPGRVGMANARALLFEASRFAARHDLDSLKQAIEHARQGTALAPGSADAWSTLGFVLCLAGEIDSAVAATSQAVFLAPASWRHWLRRAYVGWGEQRIDAAQTVLTLRPRLALAHWLTATVLIARGAFDAALRELHAGCAAQDRQPGETAAYPAVGLHLLRGLVLAAQDRLDDASREFETELAASDHGQLYWQECASNSWYALGAVRLRQRHPAGADAAFRRAIEIAPGHVFSLAALGLRIPDRDPGDPWWADAEIARAIALARAGRHQDAAQTYAHAIAAARFPNTGWLLPVEPVLRAHTHPDAWGRVLTIVEQRAT